MSAPRKKKSQSSGVKPKASADGPRKASADGPRKASADGPRKASADGPRNGRILTFYSYKGGTGRSMALANVGWILASAGKRVLLIDWDFEAPGLHRYLHPFLSDPELANTRGLIDYFLDVNVAARAAALSNSSDSWWKDWCTLARYTVSLDYEFLANGVLDFVPAGQQTVSYPIHVSSTNWQEFYEKLGGGVLLEALKEQLRADYDYVLIDSRTGISDTAGICTVQMPDTLVVFFTLNAQSIQGAAAVTGSAWSQRVTPDGMPGLHVWPVPTRVEPAEKERLDNARATAHSIFHRFVQLSRDARRSYWEQVEVPYHPFYAYEEVLAPFAEGTRGSSSVLRSMEALTSYLTKGEVTSGPRLAETERLRLLAKYLNTGRAATAPTVRKRRVFISYGGKDRAAVNRLIADLNKNGIDTWSDRNLLPGDSWTAKAQEALDHSSLMLYVPTPNHTYGDQEMLLSRALQSDKRVVPLLVDTSPAALPGQIRDRHPLYVTTKSWKRDIKTLSERLSVVLDNTTPQPASLDPEDPQKGRWGGEAVRNGRELSAKVRSVGDGWYDLTLTVKTQRGSKPLEGPVKFYLHPTFPRPEMTATATDGSASISVTTWGAFTVGAVADGGDTLLELDLAQVKQLPEEFRRS